MKPLRQLEMGPGSHGSIHGKQVGKDGERPWGKGAWSRQLKKEVCKAWISVAQDALSQGGRALILVCLCGSLGLARVAVHNPG